MKLWKENQKISEMPYKSTLAPIRTNFDKHWKIKCPKCKQKKTVSRTWRLINAYGCYDGSYAMQLECGHIVNSWEAK